VASDTADNADLRPLREIVGDARLIRYAVTQLGFKAVALETGLTASKRIYDHVIGRTTETDAALKESLSSWTRFPESLELIQWLRGYNAAQPPASQVHFYGVDLTATASRMHSESRT